MFSVRNLALVALILLAFVAGYVLRSATGSEEWEYEIVNQLVTINGISDPNQLAAQVTIDVTNARNAAENELRYSPYNAKIIQPVSANVSQISSNTFLVTMIYQYIRR